MSRLSCTGKRTSCSSLHGDQYFSSQGGPRNHQPRQLHIFFLLLAVASSSFLVSAWVPLPPPPSRRIPIGRLLAAASVRLHASKIQLGDTVELVLSNDDNDGEMAPRGVVKELRGAGWYEVHLLPADNVAVPTATANPVVMKRRASQLRLIDNDEITAAITMTTTMASSTANTDSSAAPRPKKTISVVTWNILSPFFATPSKFRKHDTSDLKWSVRMPRIGDRLRELDADIVCLQEVPPPPPTFLTDDHARRGGNSSTRDRSAMVYAPTSGSNENDVTIRDGSSKDEQWWQLLRRIAVDELGYTLIVSPQTRQDRKPAPYACAMLVRCNDNSRLSIVRTESRRTFLHVVLHHPGEDEEKEPRLLHVACAHLTIAKENEDAHHLLQVRKMLLRVDEQTRKAEEPAIILAGDFNAYQGSPTYEFLAGAKLNNPNLVGSLLKQQPRLADVLKPGRMLPFVTRLLPLQDAHAEASTPTFRNGKRYDYIWVSSSIRVEESIPNVGLDGSSSSKKDIPWMWPTVSNPSDHLPIRSVLRLL